MTDHSVRSPSTDGESAICASSLNKPSSQGGLKPCPFCGGEAKDSGHPLGIMGQIYCSNDGCFGPKTTAGLKEDSIKQWNTRHPSSNDAIEAWQPIETAPRDGTPFLCFHPDDLFSPQTGIDLIWYEPSIKTYTMDGDNEVPFAGITHWQPLPTPPHSLKLPDYRGGEKIDSTKTAESENSPSTLNAETE